MATFSSSPWQGVTDLKKAGLASKYSNNYVSTDPALNKYADKVLGANTVAEQPQQPQPTPNPQPTGDTNNNNNNNNPPQPSGPSEAELAAQRAEQELTNKLDEWGNKWNQFYGELKSSLSGEAKRKKLEAGQTADKQIARTNESAADTKKELAVDENKAMSTLDTAINEAVRAYQALAQQGRSRFGMGSSAGQAVGELARKEFFRQQGNVSGKKAEVVQEFAKEKEKLNTFVKNKVSDIEDWLRTSIGDLEANLTSELTKVEGMKMESEQARDERKLSVLQNTVQQAQKKQADAQSLFQNLFSSYITNLQEVEQRVFTPKEIQVALQEFNNTFGNIGLKAEMQTSSQPQIGTNIYATQQDEDQLV